MRTAHVETRITAAAGVLAVKIGSHRKFARHFHEQYGIGVFDAGGHRSASGRGMVEAGPGDVITVNPGEVHDGAPLGGEPRRWRMLYFDEPVLRAAASGLSDHAPSACEFHSPARHDRRARSMFDTLFRVYCGGRGGSADGLLADECLLGLIARLGTSAWPNRSSGVAAGIARVQAAIDADPAHGFTLAQLAELSGVNHYQTIRMFARATGLTPHAYLVQRRVDLARGLIREGNGLANAALAAGFSDQSHLTRAFVARFGYTPGAYAGAFRQMQPSRNFVQEHGVATV